MPVINLHLETYEISAPLEQVLDFAPLIISPCPSHIADFPEEVIEKIGYAISKNTNMLGQQGLYHKCKNSHRFTDSLHENSCIWGNSPSLEEQIRFMSEGRDQLYDLFGVKPNVYVPPNHYWNANTIIAAEELGYDYLTTLALIRARPCKIGNIIVVPESRYDFQRTDVIYLHGTELPSKISELLSLNAKSLDDLGVIEKRSMLRVNEILKNMWKVTRDLVKLPRTLLKAQ
jgi:hypothetical protein